MKDNLKSSGVGLLQPKASLREKGKEILAIAYSGQLKVNGVDEKSVE